MLDLLEMAKKSVSAPLLGKASEMLGESPDATRRGLDAALPAALGGFVQRGSTPEGAQGLLSPLKDFAPGGEVPDFGAASAPQLAQMANRGSGMMGTLFGGRHSAVVDGVARMSGLRSDKASSLLGLAVPMVGGLLGKEIFRKNLDAGGLSSLLSSQKEVVSAALPPGLLEGTLGQGVRETAGGAQRTYQTASSRPGSRQGVGRWVPIAVGAALLLGLFSWWNHHRRSAARVASRTHLSRQEGAGGAGGAGMARHYQCANGPTLTVDSVAKDRVNVSFQGTTYNLARVTAPKGERFVQGGVMWQQEGNSGVLTSGNNVLGRDCQLSH